MVSLINIAEMQYLRGYCDRKLLYEGFRDVYGDKSVYIFDISYNIFNVIIICFFYNNKIGRYLL